MSVRYFFPVCPMKDLCVLFACCALLGIVPVSAEAFADLPADHAFATHVRILAERGIMRGHGASSEGAGQTAAVRPDAVINRAEMLMLLYRATERTPDAQAGRCFGDVAEGSWYEAVVCDAAANGFVSGYPDRTFRPQQTVNRMEALKMMHTVLALPLPSAIPPTVTLRYRDLDERAWYMPYVAGAFRHGILPITGQEGPAMHPGKALLRGEAAAYVANALGLTVVIPMTEAAVSSGAASVSASSAVVASAGMETAVTIDTSFPFQVTSAHVVRFSVDHPMTGELRAIADAKFGTSGLTCRLFRMGTESGFSDEYYLGQVTANTCVIRVTLVPSSYQLEVRPVQRHTPFVVQGSRVVGDGNDGFSEAVILSLRKTRTGILEEGDIADWYTVRLDRPQTLMVSAQGNGTECMVYAGEDVDLFGFAGPQCNASYDYPSGTYVIGVQRKSAHTGQLPYSLELQ